MEKEKRAEEIGEQEMLQLTFTEAEIKELDNQRYNHPHPRVQRKMEAVLLKAKGLAHNQIAHCTGVCENTMRGYLREYQEGGIEALKRVEFYRPKSDLVQHGDTLEAYFREKPPSTIPQAAAIIEELTGLKRSPAQVGIFLKNLGLKRLKTYAVPAKIDVEEQETFKKKS
jgi:transposase